MIFVTVFDGR